MPHVKSFKSYTNNKAKEIKEDQLVMGANPEFQSQYDALNQEEAELLKRLANVKEKRILLDQEMAKVDKVAADTAVDLANQANQAQSNADQATVVA